MQVTWNIRDKAATLPVPRKRRVNHGFGLPKIKTPKPIPVVDEKTAAIREKFRIKHLELLSGIKPNRYVNYSPSEIASVLEGK